MANLFCTKCGGKLPPNAKFCVSCGNPVPQAPAVQTPPQEDLPPVAPIEQNLEPVIKQAAEPELPEPSVSEETPDNQVFTPQAEAADHEPAPSSAPFEDFEYVPHAPAAQPVEYEYIPQVPAAPAEYEYPVSDADPVQQPMVTYEQPSVPQVIGKKALRPRRRGVFRTILAVLICMSMFGLIWSTSTMCGVQSAVSERSLTSLSRRMSDEFYALLDTLPAAVVLPDISSDISMMDYLLELAAENGLALTRRGIGDILKSSQLLDTLSDRWIAYLSDIRFNTRYAAMDEHDLMEWFMQGRDIISDLVNVYITDEMLTDSVTAIADAGVLDFTDAGLLRTQVPAVYYGIQFTLSVRVLFVQLAVILALIVLLGVANRWNFFRITRDAGITFLAAGAVVIVPAVLLPGALATVLLRIPFLGNLAGVWLAYLMENMMLGGVIALTLGVLLIAGSVIIYIVSKKRACAPSPAAVL